MARELVDLPTIATRLGVPVNTLYTWRHRGQFPTPALQVGRRVAFNWTDIARWAKKEGLG